MSETLERKKTNKQIKAELSLYWQQVFKHYKANPEKQYCPHMIYPVDAAPADKFARLYKEEVELNKDLYLEATNRKLELEDSPRRLYRVKYDPAWKNIHLEPRETLEISLKDAEVITDPLLFNEASQPVITAKVVDKPAAKTTLESQPELFPANDIDEISISDLTIKDLAAILWMRPVSDRQGLNDLIKKTFKIK